MNEGDRTAYICSRCGSTFYTEKQFLDHWGGPMGRHEQGVYYCPEKTEDGKPCKFMTNDVNKLNVHINEIHYS